MIVIRVFFYILFVLFICFFIDLFYSNIFIIFIVISRVFILDTFTMFRNLCFTNGESHTILVHIYLFDQYLILIGLTTNQPF